MTQCRTFFTMLLCEFFGVFKELFLVLTIFLGKITSQWMIGFWLIDERYQSLNHLISFCCWLPVLYRDNGQTDLTFFVNIGVVDFGFKIDFRRLERIFSREYNFNSKCSFVEGRSIRNHQALPLKNVLLINNDVLERLKACLSDILKLFLKPSGRGHVLSQCNKMHKLENFLVRLRIHSQRFIDNVVKVVYF